MKPTSNKISLPRSKPVSEVKWPRSSGGAVATVGDYIGNHWCSFRKFRYIFPQFYGLSLALVFAQQKNCILLLRWVFSIAVGVQDRLKVSDHSIGIKLARGHWSWHFSKGECITSTFRQDWFAVRALSREAPQVCWCLWLVTGDCGWTLVTLFLDVYDGFWFHLFNYEFIYCMRPMTSSFLPQKSTWTRRKTPWHRTFTWASTSSGGGPQRQYYRWPDLGGRFMFRWPTPQCMFSL